MVAPGRWRDDGPQSASVRSRLFSVQADNVGQMRPVVRSVAVLTDADRQRIRELESARKRAAKDRKRPGVAFSIRMENRRCGAPLHGRGSNATMLTGEMCARTAGHGTPDHSSATTMAREAAVRRTRR